jgi:hypothetical protein
MEGFGQFQRALEDTFTSLSVFSDLEWNTIFKEYLASHEERPTDIEEFTFNFPFFLQQKSLEGDCPSYLFELAYVELAQDQILNSEISLGPKKGIHLNPTATFLNLEFDILHMLNEATRGSVQVIPRHHVLCLFRDPVSGFNHLEINQARLDILQSLEDGPRSKQELGQTETVDELLKLGLILEVS